MDDDSKGSFNLYWEFMLSEVILDIFLQRSKEKLCPNNKNNGTIFKMNT